jgi:hypothetical protein
MQNFWDTIKRPNLVIMDIREEAQTKLIAENSPILEKKMIIQVSEAFRTSD